MRRAVQFVVGAVVMLAAVEGTTRLVVEPESVLRWHDYGTQLKVTQLDELGTVDTVVVGTSMAQQGLVPAVLEELTGRTTYNAALNGGVPRVIEPWLLDQVVPRAKPSRVVWGLSSIDLSVTYGAATVTAYEGAMATRSGPLAAVDRAVSSHSRFVSSRAVLRDPSSVVGDIRDERRRDLQSARAELGERGERLNFEEAASGRRAGEVRDRVNPYALDPDDLAAIVRTVDALQAQEIEVVFVELPVPPRLMTLYPDGPATHQRFQSALQLLADELKVPLAGPSETTSYDDTDFVDFTHLNAVSANDFSRRTAQQLNP